MIISRTPLRVSLGGGGTDLPSYYRNHGSGFLLAAAITRHVYVAVNTNFDPNYLLKYSSVERSDEVNGIKHPLLRECIRLLNVPPRVEISSMADIPAGTGLGSSGAFTVGVLKALAHFQCQSLTNEQLAESACTIEIDRLGENVGKQDQYITAIGGITAFTFNSDESVGIERLALDSTVRQQLEKNLLLFYTGVRRSASSVLLSEADSSGGLVRADTLLSETREIGYQTRDLLIKGDVEEFGRLLTHQWKLKYHRQPSALHEQIDGVIQLGIRHGALGGKLVGAGGGGFLLFFAESKNELRQAMAQVGLTEVPFGVDYLGSTVIVSD